MADSLRKVDHNRPTIARDLTVGLVRVLLAVFVVAASTNFFITLNRDARLLREKAEEISNNLASVLVTPMWNLNREELEKIISVYRQSGIVSDIELAEIQESSDHRETVSIMKVPWKHPAVAGTLTMSRDIVRLDDREGTQLIGRVQIRFADPESTRKQLESILYSITVFASISVALFFATTILLRRFLREPLDALATGLNFIAEGNYRHQLPPARQYEVASISDKVQVMAREIEKREEALQQNQSKLETLNVAILDIFSCATPDALIRQTMVQAFRVSNCETITFAVGPAKGEDIPERGLSSLVAIRGQVFDADAATLATHAATADDRRVFAFPLKSRDRTIGTMTVAFTSQPDVVATQILRSLLSLATMALIRLAEIREKAFMDTELQVAETMQQSMVFDYKSKPPRTVVIADHYEPVLRVGGDWFSIIESEKDDSVFVIMGDVTGHGLAQGLITTAMAGAMTLIESWIKDQDQSAALSPAAVITHLNTVMQKLLGTSTMRMTCVAAQINYGQGWLKVCNAGHTFPLVLRQSTEAESKVEALSRQQQRMLGASPIEAARTHNYIDAHYHIAAGDLLVFYTDGLTEARGKDGRSFHRPFQRHVSKISSSRTATDLRDEILLQFRTHTLDVPVQDDICLIVIGKRQTTVQQVA